MSEETDTRDALTAATIINFLDLLADAGSLPNGPTPEPDDDQTGDEER